MQAAWQIAKIRGVTLQEFIKLHEETLFFILPKDAFTRIIDKDGKFDPSCVSDIRIIVASGGLGDAFYHADMVRLAAQPP